MNSNGHRALWIVVADFAEARVYSCRNHEPPVLVEQLAHPAAHTRDRDLTSDRPGSVGHQSLAPATEPGDIERVRFARAVAEALDRGHETHRFGELALVMAPKLLGLVREHLGRHTAGAVVAALDLRLNDMPIEEVVQRVAQAREEARP